jgi:hypothetical protein
VVAEGIRRCLGYVPKGTHSQTNHA